VGRNHAVWVETDRLGDLDVIVQDGAADEVMHGWPVKCPKMLSLVSQMVNRGLAWRIHSLTSPRRTDPVASVKERIPRCRPQPLLP